MLNTPFFPPWRARLHRRGRVFKTTVEHCRRCTLDQLEDQLAPLLRGIDALQPSSGRERPYSVRRTWWCFLWQMLQINTSCRDVVRQLQAAFVLAGRSQVDPGTSAYCQARARLPQTLFAQALRASASAADQRVPAGDFLQGRVVKTVDMTTLTLPDTAANQAAYPQPPSQRPGCGSPLMHLLVVSSARSGAILDYVCSDYHHGEMRLLHQLCPRLAPHDVVVYDRAAGHFMACALLSQQHVDLISRVSIRRIDWRRGQRLGPNERLVRWKKTHSKPPYLTAEQWAQLPDEIPVRVIRLRIQQKGFSARELVLVTTLLDPVAYPAEQIAAAYLQRWRLEMGLDDLKTTLGLDALRCKSPDLVQRELLTLLIAHNLVRALMAEAAREHRVSIERLSFKGSLDTLRTLCSAASQATRPATRRILWTHMLRMIALDEVPLRPDRCEPRAVKRRPKAYPWLDRPRHLYRDKRHENCLPPKRT